MAKEKECRGSDLCTSDKTVKSAENMDLREKTKKMYKRCFIGAGLLFALYFLLATLSFFISAVTIGVDGNTLQRNDLGMLISNSSDIVFVLILIITLVASLLFIVHQIFCSESILEKITYGMFPLFFVERILFALQTSAFTPAWLEFLGRFVYLTLPLLLLLNLSLKVVQKKWLSLRVLFLTTLVTLLATGLAVGSITMMSL